MSEPAPTEVQRCVGTLTPEERAKAEKEYRDWVEFLWPIWRQISNTGRIL